MSIYERDPDAAPDSDFEGGDFHHLVVGNRGRLLDPRRTPVTVVELRPTVGTFVLRIEGFEDRGALWEEPIENVGHYQFACGAARATGRDVDRFREAIARFDRKRVIPCEEAARAETLASLRRERDAADEWLAGTSVFFAERGTLPDAATRRGDRRLAGDLQRFLAERGLETMEEAFARQFVSNPHSGELVKGHRIVLAELGLVPYDGKVVRDPALFDPPWEREARGRHVVARLAFVSAMLSRMGLARVPLYRGISTETPLLPPENPTFVSATFDPEVARSHFESGTPHATRALYRQSVPAERVFMTYLETEAMNRQFLEAEAVLLFEPGNVVF